MKKGIFYLLTFILLTNLLSFALTPSLVRADVESDIRDQLQPIEDVYGQENPSDTTLAETIAKIIKIVLGFLGVIFIVLIIYAGFSWMTSAGNEEKISKAKKTMAAAVVGVAIIIAAYAITFFVIDKLLEASGVSSHGLD